MKNTSVAFAQERHVPRNFVEGSQEVSLWHTNTNGSRNDINMQRILKEYNKWDKETVVDKMRGNRLPNNVEG